MSADSAPWATCGGHRPPLHFAEWLRCIAEAVEVDIHLVHEREVEPAHLAIRFAGIVEDATALDATTAAPEDDHWELVVVVIAGEHRGAIENHRVVQRGAFAFLDGVELARDVGELFNEKLVYLQPVGRVAVRE